MAILRRGACAPLSFCIAAAFWCASAHAASYTVISNCADDGSPGTLRSVLNGFSAADNNAVIDVSACSTITLAQGELAIPLSVAILGPLTGTTTLDANHVDRVIEATGTTAATSNLTLTNLTLRGGRVITTDGQAYGGCVLGEDLTLNGSTVTDCFAHSDTSLASGGAIAARTLNLYRSTVVSNAAESGAAFAFGGAITANTLSCQDSGVELSQASGQPGEGGGIAVYGAANFERCTIAENASDYAGGIFANGANDGTGVSATLTVVNSTISGNQASTYDAGIFSAGPLILRNSTVTNNYAPACAGVQANRDVQADSNIIARNRAAPGSACNDLRAGGTVTGSHNLVGIDDGGLPPDTLITNPHLSPLAEHGGPTRTHALLSASPAIDAGSNVDTVSTDQRGDGFTRSVGLGVDIGAYERQMADDEVFYDGFEG